MRTYNIIKKTLGRVESNIMKYIKKGTNSFGISLTLTPGLVPTSPEILISRLFPPLGKFGLDSSQKTL